jgi:ATP-binding protein involved in chromosome partitioning
MVAEEQVRKSLEAVLVPNIKRSLVGLNLVREIAVTDQQVKITLASTALSGGSQEWLKNKVTEAVGKLPDVNNNIEVEFTSASPVELNKIDHIVAVMSGKGGVGKSLVASLVAVSLKRQGYEVGILDADITGPSIPKMFGITFYPSPALR